MLTTKGAYTLAGGVAAILGGLVLDQIVFTVAGCAAIVLVALARLGLAHVELDVRREASATVATEGSEVTVSLHLAPKVLKGRAFVEVRDTLPDSVELANGSNYAIAVLKGTDAVDLSYRFGCPVKGKVRLGPLRVRVQDVFGFFAVDRDEAEATLVTVYPRQYDLRDAMVRSRFPLVVSGDYLVGQPGYGSSFFALREYQTGDPYRSINWKASARSKNFVVNQTERESHARATFFFDLRAAAALGTPRSNAVVHGARAVASMAAFMFKRRDKARLVFYGDGIKDVDARGDRAVIAVQEALAEAEPAGDMTLLAAMDQVLPLLKRRSPVVIVSNLYDDTTVIDAVRSLRAYDMMVLVVSPSSVKLLEAAGVPADSPQAKIARTERELLLTEIKSFGATVVDWDPNEPFSITMAREMLL